MHMTRPINESMPPTRFARLRFLVLSAVCIVAFGRRNTNGIPSIGIQPAHAHKIGLNPRRRATSATKDARSVSPSISRIISDLSFWFVLIVASAYSVRAHQGPRLKSTLMSQCYSRAGAHARHEQVARRRFCNDLHTWLQRN